MTLQRWLAIESLKVRRKCLVMIRQKGDLNPFAVRAFMHVGPMAAP